MECTLIRRWKWSRLKMLIDAFADRDALARDVRGFGIHFISLAEREDFEDEGLYALEKRGSIIFRAQGKKQKGKKQQQRLTDRILAPAVDESDFQSITENEGVAAVAAESAAAMGAVLKSYQWVGLFFLELHWHNN